MKYAKVAISIEESILKKIDRLVKSKAFESRSQVFQKAAQIVLDKIEKNRLTNECLKLDKKEEQQFANKGLDKDLKEWPEY